MLSHVWDTRNTRWQDGGLQTGSTGIDACGHDKIEILHENTMFSKAGNSLVLRRLSCQSQTQIAGVRENVVHSDMRVLFECGR